MEVVVASFISILTKCVVDWFVIRIWDIGICWFSIWTFDGGINFFCLLFVDEFITTAMTIQFLWHIHICWAFDGSKSGCKTQFISFQFDLYNILRLIINWYWVAICNIDDCYISTIPGITRFSAINLVVSSIVTYLFVTNLNWIVIKICWFVECTWYFDV